ncbi:stress-inducible protein [Actinidia rufa]|uniref:Stress-inducible protein n=1 Tax=Actinidia rufa TaxID=165716 RepID=A0A7J0DDI7_9ERIC|nr:stress-inducible protein [Actinidia rufa]
MGMKIRERDRAESYGNASFTTGNYTDAIHHFTEAISLAPDNHVLYSNRSSAHASARKFTEAFSDAEKAVEIKLDWSKGYYRVGSAHKGLRRYDDAVSAYKNGLEIDPTTGPSSPASPPPSPPLPGLASPRPSETSLLGRRYGPGSSPIRPRGPSFNRTISRIRCWTPNSAEDADIPDAEMTEEEPEPEDMDVPEEEREARERKKEAHKEKEKGNAAYKKKDFEAAIQHYAKAIELDDKDISFLTNRAVVYYLEMGQSSDVFEQEQNVIASRKITRSNEKDHEGGSERAREKARKMLLLLRGRDEAAAAEEDEAFEGGPSRARHRVGRNSGPIYIDLEFRRVRARTKRDCTEKDHKVERERSRQPRRRRRCLREDRVGFGTESVGTRMVLTPLMVPSTGRFQAPVGAVCRCVEQINIMTQFGYYCFYRCLSVPPGFTISTEACQEYQQNGKKLPDGLWDQILEGLETVQKDMGAFLGDPSRPLLLSVRSGAAIRPLFEEDGNVVEVALIKDKRTGQQQGLKHESRNQELLDGARRCVEQINKASCGDLSPKELKEREVKAIQDPEIQSILTDPVMSQVLIDFDENPKAALEHAKNPVVMNKKCQHWDDNPAIMAVGVVDGTSEAVFRTVMSLGASRSQ